MKIDELIDELEQVKEEHGNLEVRSTEATTARNKDIVYVNNMITVLKDDWERPEYLD